jgi:hypothetical protein
MRDKGCYRALGGETINPVYQPIGIIEFNVEGLGSTEY